MDDFLQYLSKGYVTSQMARRLACQFKWMAGDEHDMHLCNAMTEEGYEELPKGWMKVSEEWCKDHSISILHGVMALLYFRNMFGLNWSASKLRTILDKAFEEAKKIR